MLCWNISSGISLSPTSFYNWGDNVQNVILLINEMGLKESGVLLSDTRDRSWDFGLCLWNACSPVSSLGGSISSERRYTWKESSGKTNESSDLSGKVERIGAVESGGDCSEA